MLLLTCPFTRWQTAETGHYREPRGSNTPTKVGNKGKGRDPKVSLLGSVVVSPIGNFLLELSLKRKTSRKQWTLVQKPQSQMRCHLPCPLGEQTVPVPKVKLELSLGKVS